MSRRVLARTDEVQPGTCKIVSAMGREIGIFNVGGEYYALSNRCPHMGAELCKGWVVGLVQSDGPGRASFCAAPGTAGSSRSVLASPIATPSR